MGQNRLTLVVKSTKGEQVAFQSAESTQQQTRWLRLADIALGNPVEDYEKDILHPGQSALEEHKRVIRKVREAADTKVLLPSFKGAV